MEMAQERNERSDVTFEIVSHLGVLTEKKDGWTKELNLVSWNGGNPPKFDKDLQQAMYDIAKEIGIDPKALFTSMYQVLIAKDQGPRLASFMKIIGKDKLNKLLENY